MEKIIIAINKMIENSHLISSVISSGSEFYFLYNQKVKWSIMQFEDDDIILTLYPDTTYDLEYLSGVGDLIYINKVVYSSSDFKTREAFESFYELLQVVRNKVFGVDDLLNDIINDN